jgi:hypothetical protein
VETFNCNKPRIDSAARLYPKSNTIYLSVFNNDTVRKTFDEELEKAKLVLDVTKSKNAELFDYLKFYDGAQLSDGKALKAFLCERAILTTDDPDSLECPIIIGGEYHYYKQTYMLHIANLGKPDFSGEYKSAQELMEVLQSELVQAGVLK